MRICLVYYRYELQDEWFDGSPIVRWVCSASDCNANILSTYSRDCKALQQLGGVDLDAAPSLAGQNVYIVLQARVNASTTDLQLWIETDQQRLVGGHPDDTNVLASNSRVALAAGWQLFSFQATLGWSGHVQFGVRAFAKKDGVPIVQHNTPSTVAAVDHVQVDIAGIVLAQIGSEWGRTFVG